MHTLDDRILIENEKRYTREHYLYPGIALSFLYVALGALGELIGINLWALPFAFVALYSTVQLSAALLELCARALRSSYGETPRALTFGGRS